jgi:hypothetical protein
MSTLIKINIRKEDGSYVNYMGSISDHFDLNGNNIKFFEMQTKEEREQKTPKNYVFNGKVVWTDGIIIADKKTDNSIK